MKFGFKTSGDAKNCPKTGCGIRPAAGTGNIGGNVGYRKCIGDGKSGPNCGSLNDAKKLSLAQAARSRSQGFESYPDLTLQSCKELVTILKEI